MSTPPTIDEIGNVEELAAACRQWCDRSSQGSNDETPCGSILGSEGNPTFTFCGYHMVWAIGLGDGS